MLLNSYIMLESLTCIYFFGDYYIRVIPVPMPNTEVKPYVLKILADISAGKISRR